MLSLTTIILLVLLVLVLLAVGIPIGFALGGVSVLGVMILMGPNGLYMLFATEDQQEGMAAFVQKRPPEWRGK